MNNINFELDPNHKTPLYRQLSNKIEDAILSGALERGDRLPPTRQLAQRLNTARRTVVKAYDELLSRGYLEGKVGAGTTISRHLPLVISNHGKSASKCKPITVNLEEKLSSYARNLSCSYSAGLKDSDLNPALNSTDLLPRKIWRQLLLRDCMQNCGELVDSSLVAGYKPLQEVVAQFLTRTKGVICQPEQILVYAGPQQAVEQIIKLLVDPDDLVVVEDPSSESVKDMLSSHGARILAKPVDSRGLRTEALVELHEVPKIAYLTPSCQNPTGAIMASDRKAELIEWARRREVILVEDAFDSDIRFGSQVTASLQGASPDNTIYLYGFHKLLFPLTSLTVVVMPSQLVAAASRARSLVESQSSNSEARVLAEFIACGHLDIYIRKIRRIFQERRQVLVYMLATCLRQAASISTRTAGTRAVIRLDEAFDERFILECGKRSGLPLISTRAGYVECESLNEFAIPFSNLDQNELRRRVELFSDLLAKDDRCQDSACISMPLPFAAPVTVNLPAS